MTMRGMIPVFNDSSVIPAFIKITLSFPIVIDITCKEKSVNQGIRNGRVFFLVERLRSNG
jgi:hypothetical protein